MAAVKLCCLPCVCVCARACFRCIMILYINYYTCGSTRPTTLDVVLSTDAEPNNYSHYLLNNIWFSMWENMFMFDDIIWSHELTPDAKVKFMHKNKKKT